MFSFKWAAILSVTAFVFLLSASEASADSDACKILPVEKFSEIMGYKAKVTTSSESTCLYGGAGGSGGMLMILSEEATPQMIAMVDREGSTPRGEPGKLGATFSKGKVVFSVAIKGTDPSKVSALAAEVKRNLK